MTNEEMADNEEIHLETEQDYFDDLARELEEGEEDGED